MNGRWLCLLLISVLSFTIVNPLKGSSSSFPITLEIGKIQSEKPNFNEIVRKFRTLIHLYPFLLDRYLQTGDVLLVNEVRETTDAVDKCLNLMGKAVENNLQKEMFAKVMAGSQKLKKNVEANLLAIDRYRITKLVFDKRASQLLERLRMNSLEITCQSGGDKSINKKQSLRALLDNVIADALRSIFATQFSLQRPDDESRRNRTRALWESTLKSSKRATEAAVSLEKKGLIAFLNPTLKSLDDLTADLFVRTDELRRAWDNTLSQVHSLEELLGEAEVPRTTKDSKTKVPSKSKP
jgi:hypothetical protein